jgi:hypothetical protein
MTTPALSAITTVLLHLSVRSHLTPPRVEARRWRIRLQHWAFRPPGLQGH